MCFYFIFLFTVHLTVMENDVTVYHFPLFINEKGKENDFPLQASWQPYIPWIYDIALASQIAPTPNPPPGPPDSCPIVKQLRTSD